MENSHLHDPTEDLVNSLPDLSGMPFTRRQHVLGITQTHEFIKGTTMISLRFKNKRQRVWCPIEGDATATVSVADRIVEKKRYLDANSLWSETFRHFLICDILSYLDLSDQPALALVVSAVSLALLILVTMGKDLGFSAVEVVFTIDVETVDLYYEEEVIAQAMRESAGVAGPASRSSIEALPSRAFGDMNSSDTCSICLDEYSRGMIVTRLPCSHDFHQGCIERWLNETNSCPLCRAMI
ncbi:E3 ubiquitin-protein ligase MBR1-like protein [Cinnamomum micranthum f. kanehirae]|uniref:E3 ubiquitin-protein ligase MBR1-like protein n=1 Tax=Cinnamomum micranthum f. kanehirae TaxID=337451 RepID=A0A443NF37_9MAGN|nr:E3 ubiquitin-protein ligase MBR1-like protein [Cinnamomum micranthum f. kanehirae]